MTRFFKEPSRTFSEFLLIPNLTAKDNIPEQVSLSAPVVKYNRGEQPSLKLNIPLTSAIMQAVSGDTMAIALARCGGISFIYVSQPIEDQVRMVRNVKNFKAGFVESDSNLTPENSVRDLLRLKKRTGHNTIAITEDGSPHGKLSGLLTSRDYRLSKVQQDTKVGTLMTPFEKLVIGKDPSNLSDANQIIWDRKINCLPIIDKEQHLQYLVFRKDYDEHKRNPDELIDNEKRLVVGAGINTRDYKERVPALIDAGADILCIDQSDGFNEWQSATIQFIKNEYGDAVKVGAGNVVDKEGFLYLAEAGADFVKIGIGPGSICITREQKGIGRGQATAVMDVAQARNEYFKETGVYIPLCSDGGIVHDYHIVLALAMGSDFVMMGRYFARFDESPSKKLRIRGAFVKEYWAEGSNRARNWQRYDVGGGEEETLTFEEGVDVYIPYAGKLQDNLAITINKIRATMCNCGSRTIEDLQTKARLTVVSSTSIRESGAHDVIMREQEFPSEA